MALFKDLSFSSIISRRIYIDLDGTLVPDGEEEVSPGEAHALHALSQGREVYIISNKGIVRAPKVAAAHGIQAITTRYKKPNPRALASVSRPEGMPTVIGDKFLTDGIFAWRIGARFIKVDPIRSDTDGLSVRAAYALDRFVWRLWQGIRWLRWSTPVSFIELARPEQWIKNFLIFAPLFFSGWVLHQELFVNALIAFIAFSFAASAGYAINDMFDCAEDMRHPTKCTRPIASGRVSIGAGSLFGVLLGFVAVLAASFLPMVIPWIGLYLILSYLYTSFGKHIPILEGMSVALFYLIRVLVGGAVVGVPVTSWLLVTVFLGAYYMTASKRLVEHKSGSLRPVLRSYGKEFLVILPAILASLTMAAYLVYTLENPHQGMVYSSIFVLFGILWHLNARYRFDPNRPDRETLSFFVVGCSVLLWLGYLYILLY